MSTEQKGLVSRVFLVNPLDTRLRDCFEAWQQRANFKPLALVKLTSIQLFNHSVTEFRR